MLIKWLLVMLSLGVAIACFAQDAQLPVKFDGQIRMRTEGDARDFDSGSDVNTFTLLRTRFGARIEPLPNAQAYIQLQDSRAFGMEPNTLASTNNLDLHQAYFEIKKLWDKSISLRVGRQEMVYGGQRLIGAVGWSNVGRSFDGVKLTFGKQANFDLFSMIITESNTPVPGPATPTTTAGRDNADYTFFGAYYKYRPSSGIKMDVYGLYESNLMDTDSGDNELTRFTLGSHANGTFSRNFKFESEFAVQLGDRRGQDVQAFMLTGSIGYAFQDKGKPSLSIGYDYLSGMDAGDTDYKAFDTIFATNHKFYGFMDYFVNVPVNTGGQGLRDFMIKAKVPFASKWNLNGHFHNFRAAQGREKDFGNELDLTLNYKYNSAATFVFGLSLFAPGDLMEQRFGNNDLGIWSYSMLALTF